MDKLAKYKLDKSFTEGVEIRLDNAPDVVFLVTLPSMYNRNYAQAMYSGMSMSMSDDGNITADTNIVVARYVQEDAFFDHCLKEMDGEPVPESFKRDYPEALTELMTKATELANDIENRVNDAVGKSQASSTGKADGQEKSNSKPSLSKAVG